MYIELVGPGLGLVLFDCYEENMKTVTKGAAGLYKALR
jgi:hypothetical protein